MQKTRKNHTLYSATQTIAISTPTYEFEDLSAEEVQSHITIYPDWLVTDILENLNKFKLRISTLNLIEPKFFLTEIKDEFSEGSFLFRMEALKPLTNSEKERRATLRKREEKKERELLAKLKEKYES